MTTPTETYDASTFANLLAAEMAINPSHNGVEIVFDNKEILSGGFAGLNGKGFVTLDIHAAKGTATVIVDDNICRRRGGIKEFTTGVLEEARESSDNQDRSQHGTSRNTPQAASGIEQRIANMESAVHALVDLAVGPRTGPSNSQEDEEDEEEENDQKLPLNPELLHRLLSGGTNNEGNSKASRRRQRTDDDSADENDDCAQAFRAPEKLTARTNFSVLRRSVHETLGAYEQQLRLRNKAGIAARTENVKALARMALYFVETLLSAHGSFKAIPRNIRECVKQSCSVVYGELIFFRAACDPRVKGKDTARNMGLAGQNEANGEGTNSDYNRMLRSQYEQTQVLRQAFGRDSGDSKKSFRLQSNFPKRGNNSNNNKFHQQQHGKGKSASGADDKG